LLSIAQPVFARFHRCGPPSYVPSRLLFWAADGAADDGVSRLGARLTGSIRAGKRPSGPYPTIVATGLLCT
jgi:hypothetical protein